MVRQLLREPAELLVDRPRALVPEPEVLVLEPDIAGVAVERVQSNDGVKYLMADGGWLLIRPSGTEPVLRVYAEAPEIKMVEALLAYGQSVAATA